MTARELQRRAIGSVWGRTTLPQWTGIDPGPEGPIGEIWFEGEGGADAELLVKYLFTSQWLSIQVHPDDDTARARGYARGKDEAWIVLEAEPGAEIGIGLKREVDPEELRAAALDGSIEELLDRKRVTAGDVFYSPAGTIHAIGPGLVLLEIQQNVDLTYRLYDYGRPRELHLEHGIAAALPRPFEPQAGPFALEPRREMLTGGPAFTVERWRGEWSGRIDAQAAGSIWLIPLSVGVSLGNLQAQPGRVWALEATEDVGLEADAELLVAYPRPQPVPNLRLAL